MTDHLSFPVTRWASVTVHFLIRLNMGSMKRILKERDYNVLLNAMCSVGSLLCFVAAGDLAHIEMW